MDEAVVRALGRLGAQSLREKRKDMDIPPDERMLAITEDTGRLLNILVRSAGFTDVLEIGTSVGYSTIWLAEAAGGSVTTIEQSSTKIARAERNIAEAGLSNVTILEGAALDILRGMDRKFDFALIDADKENASTYFDLVLGILRPGGIIAVDNMLYPERYRDMMDRLAAHIRTIPGVRTVTVPIGNGVEISTRI